MTPPRAIKWIPEALLILSGAAFVLMPNGTLLVAAVAGVSAIAVIVSLRMRDASFRLELMAMASIMLVIAIPFKRIPNPTLPLITICVALVVFGLVGMIGTRANDAKHPDRRWPRGTLLIGALVVILAGATVSSDSVASLIRLLPFAAAALPIHQLLGRSSRENWFRVGRFVVILALIESALAVAEPFLFPKHLWAPAQIGSLGQIVPLMNPLLGDSLERAQGTLGHPLALGLLLLVAIAIVLRGLRSARLPLRILLLAVLTVGLVMSGSRNSLLLAVVLVLFFGSRMIGLVRIILGSAVTALLVVGAIATNVITQEVQDDFLGSGSYTHRLGAYDALGRLLSDQQLPTILFGNGTSSSDWLFKIGLLQSGNLNAVDNQFVLTMAQGGIVSLAIVAALAVGAIIRAPLAVRPAVISIVASMLIFDMFAWPSATVLAFGIFAVALNGAPAPEQETHPQGDMKWHESLSSAEPTSAAPASPSPRWPTLSTSPRVESRAPVYGPTPTE